MVEMYLASIRVQMPDNTPVVLLQEASGRRTLPILIGHPEATAIAFALQGVETPRPMTHDLMKELVASLGARIDHIEITDLIDKTYYAEIRLETAGGTVTVSSRPSDAMALAVRVGATIYADEDLLDAEGVVIEEPDEAEDEDVIQQFRSFIEDIRPEDFAG